MQTGRAGDVTGSPAPSTRRSRVDSASISLEALTKVNLKEAEATAIPEVERKSFRDLWYLHGEYYDLTEFIPTHPGGSAILLLAKGMEDATPVMESYHAFANKEYISKLMSKYKVNYVPKDVEQHVKPQVDYSFDKDGFYATLTRRVRAHFGSTKENESITKRIKANKWWGFKVATQALLYIGLYGSAFFMPGLGRFKSMGLAAAAGLMLIGVGMNAMHDGSHYAIGERDSWKNKFTMRLWNAIAFWDPAQWLYHHAIRHHAYTGDDQLDPDTMHANPAVRKHLDSPRKEYINFPRFLAVEQWFWTVWATFIYVLAPGMYTMQCISYKILWPLQGTLWKMDYEHTRNAFKKYWWETGITTFMLASHLFKADPFVTLAYLTAANLTYAACIVPDHDTYDTVVDNHKGSGRVDWGEIQVRHASDFGGHGLSGRAFTEFFGCINVQIAHHLYPSMNHIHLPEIAPIIQETCAEFKIPYARQPTVLAAAWSFMRTVHRCMSPDFVALDAAAKLE